MTTKATALFLAAVLAVVLLVASVMQPTAPKQLYACGGTHTTGPTGELICTGGVP